MPRIDVFSDGDPAELNAVTLAIFEVWTSWALGQRTLGGRRLRQPTGTYASALRVEAEGKNHVAIFVDESVAPHAEYLETGHKAYSMLDYLTPGMRIPIKRTGFVAGPGLRYAINPRTGQASRARSSGLYRAGRFVSALHGIVRVPRQASGQNTSGTGPAWTVPAMPAYSPARNIAALFGRRIADMGGAIFSR
jgi:hypothetical protein